MAAGGSLNFLNSNIECARDPLVAGRPENFVKGCSRFLTAAENQDPRLAQDDAAGETFRQTIQARLQGVLDDVFTSRATAIGAYSRASGDRSTALGSSAQASGENSTAVGRSAQAHGDRSVALGTHSGAGAWVASRRYADVAAYLADEDRAGFGRRHAVVADGVYSIAELEAMGSSLSDATLPTALANASEVISPSRSYGTVQAYLNDPARTGHAQVFIGRNVYNVAELEAVQALTETSLPNPLKGAFGAVAVGVGAQAPGQRAVAVGLDAHAVGDNAIAIGSEVTAGANEVVIGSTDTPTNCRVSRPHRRGTLRC